MCHSHVWKNMLTCVTEKNASNTREGQFKREEQFVMFKVLAVSVFMLTRAWGKGAAEVTEAKQKQGKMATLKDRPVTPFIQIIFPPHSLHNFPQTSHQHMSLWETSYSHSSRAQYFIPAITDSYSLSSPNIISSFQAGSVCAICALSLCYHLSLDTLPTHRQIPSSNVNWISPPIERQLPWLSSPHRTLPFPIVGNTSYQQHTTKHIIREQEKTMHTH